MALSYNDAAAEVMWWLVTDPTHGYSQYARYGDGTISTYRLSDDTLVSVHGGDYDCSSGSIECYECLGVSCGGASYTGNMRECMLGSGNFQEISPYEAGVGDVLLREGHTEIVVGGWEGELKQAGFRISEQGTIYGEVGDQTGWESTYSAYNPSAWETAFRCIKIREEQPEQDESEEEMACIFQPNGENYQMYYDGVELHPLANPDEAEAIKMVYAATHGGREIPIFQLGNPSSPWGNRFINAVQRKAEVIPYMGQTHIY